MVVLVSFLRNLHRGCTNLHFHQQCMRGSLFSILSPAFVICRLFNDGHSNRCEVIYIVVLICISLIVRLTIFSCAYSLSHVRFFATPSTVACQAPLSMGFSRQGYWSGLPFPSPSDLPDPGIEPVSPALQADSLLSHQGSPDN